MKESTSENIRGDVCCARISNTVAQPPRVAGVAVLGVDKKNQNKYQNHTIQYHIL